MALETATGLWAYEDDYGNQVLKAKMDEKSLATLERILAQAKAFGNAKIHVYKNFKRKSDKHPHYNLCISYGTSESNPLPKEPPQQQQDNSVGPFISDDDIPF